MARRILLLALLAFSVWAIFLVSAFFIGGFRWDWQSLSLMPIPSVDGDLGIASGKPCGPPCFQGIRPGVTSFDDAARVFKNVAFCKVGDNKKSVGPGTPIDRSIVCQSGSQVNVIIFSVGMEDTKHIVQEIDLSPAGLTVDQLIAQYGVPGAMILGSLESIKPTGVILYYDRLQTTVFLEAVNDGTYALTPETAVRRLIYKRPGDYLSDKSNSAASRTKWKGYGSFLSPAAAAATESVLESSRITVTLQELAAHPESYNGKWVELHNVPVTHVYCSSEFTVGTPSENVYVDYAVPIPAMSFQEGDNIGLVIGKVGGDCKGYYPAKALICGYIYVEGPAIIRAPAPWSQSCNLQYGR